MYDHLHREIRNAIIIVVAVALFGALLLGWIFF